MRCSRDDTKRANFNKIVESCKSNESEKETILFYESNLFLIKYLLIENKKISFKSNS